MQVQSFQAQADNLAGLYGIPDYTTEDGRVIPASDRLLTFAARHPSGALPLDVAAELLAARVAQERQETQRTKLRAAKRGLPPTEGGASSARATPAKTESKDFRESFDRAWDLFETGSRKAARR